MRKIVRGSTDDSYGIEVAKLAGIPQCVIKRAKQILSSIEQQGFYTGDKVVKEPEPEGFNMLTQLNDSINEEIASRIKALDINTLTPIEAIGILYELKKTLGE